MISVAGGKLTTYRRIALAVLHASVPSSSCTGSIAAHGRCRARPIPTSRSTRSDGGIQSRSAPLRRTWRGRTALAEEVIAAGRLEPLGDGVTEVEAQVLYAREREGTDPGGCPSQADDPAVTGRDSDEVRRRVESLLAS